MKSEQSLAVLRAAIEAQAFKRGQFVTCIVWDESGELDIASSGPIPPPGNLLATVFRAAADEVDDTSPVVKERVPVGRA